MDHHNPNIRSPGRYVIGDILYCIYRSKISHQKVKCIDRGRDSWDVNEAGGGGKWGIRCFHQIVCVCGWGFLLGCVWPEVWDMRCVVGMCGCAYGCVCNVLSIDLFDWFPFISFLDIRHQNVGQVIKQRSARILYQATTIWEPLTVEFVIGVQMEDVKGVLWWVSEPNYANVGFRIWITMTDKCFDRNIFLHVTY